MEKEREPKDKEQKEEVPGAPSFSWYESGPKDALALMEEGKAGGVVLFNAVFFQREKGGEKIGRKTT